MLLKKLIILFLMIATLSYSKNSSNNEENGARITENSVETKEGKVNKDEIEKKVKSGITPKNVQELNDYAYELEQEGDLKNAEYLLEKILEKFPNRVVANLNYGDVLWKQGKKEKSKQYYEKYIKQMITDNKEEKIPNSVLENLYLTYGIDLKNDENIKIVNGKYILKLKNNWDVDYDSYYLHYGTSLKFAYFPRHYIEGNETTLINLFKTMSFVFDKKESLKDLYTLLKYKILNVGNENEKMVGFDFFHLDLKEFKEIDFSNVDSVLFEEVSNIPKIKIKKGSNLWFVNYDNKSVKLGENIKNIRYEDLNDFVMTELTLLELMKYDKSVFRTIEKIKKICYGDIYAGFSCSRSDDKKNREKEIKSIKKYFKEEYNLEL